jgi:alpha-glucosidase
MLRADPRPHGHPRPNDVEQAMIATDGSRPWWQDGVIYQIYIRSFQDSNGDGIGDLPGISSRLDYLTWLGVDGIWLTPFYRSPMVDFGYDVSDHCDVDPAYGTLEDFDRLVAAAHARGIRVIVDFVPNHTSREHPWFEESRSSPASVKRDWYIWADPKKGRSPPNNWRGGLRGEDGGAWAWDEATGQWYLATFSPSQPDLNWRNPHVREAMLDVLEFWLARGVDGVRIDMVDFLGKDPQLREESPLPPGAGTRDYFALARHQLNRPETLDYIRAMREVADRHGERVLIGEVIYFLPVERFATYYGDGDLLDLPTNFRLTFLPFESRPIAAWIKVYDSALAAAGAWPNYSLGNHDSPRVARHGEDSARLAAMLLLTLRGTPFMYYGDEIGMPEVNVPAEQRRDRLFVDPNTDRSRDGSRTPMPWTNAPNAGFCPADAQPWLPLAPNFCERNVASEQNDERSLLQLTRRLLSLRRAMPALRAGNCILMPTVPEGCLVYRREHADSMIVVALNFGLETAIVTSIPVGARILASTGCDRRSVCVGPSVRLGAREGIVLEAPGASDICSSGDASLTYHPRGVA